MGDKVIITRKILGLQEALSQVPKDWQVWCQLVDQPLTKQKLIKQAQDATAILVVNDKIDETIIKQLPKLKVLSNYGVGVDNIDLDAAKKHNVFVTNLPSEVTYSTAEMTMALLLAVTRRLKEADHYVRNNNPLALSPITDLMGMNLAGKEIGLVGFGRIGQKVAKMAHAFDMKVSYYARTRRYEKEETLNATYKPFSELIQSVDVLSLHIPGGSETHHMIGERQFYQMKRNSILINTARGSIVDEQALVDALKNKHLQAAGIDVFEKEPFVNPELLDLDNVVMTPHLGTSTFEARYSMTNSAVNNIIAVLVANKPKNRVV